MKKQSRKADHKTETSKKKTPLDNFSLFYEEIPLQLATSDEGAKQRSNDRLSRKSKN